MARSASKKKLKTGAGKQVAGKTLIVQGGTLIDGTGGSPLVDSVIVVEGERIKSVGSAARPRFQKAVA